jgi:D-amino-acid dehydrogenase
MSGRRVLVVGAGVVGLCCAWELAKRGFAVAILDPNEPGSGCSSGNAGAVSPGSVVPLALPGAASSGFKMLLDRDGALTVKPSYALRAAPWLWRFVRAAAPARVEAVATALGALVGHALDEHRRLMAEVGAPDLIRADGQLYVYRDAAQLAKDDLGWELRRRHGVRLVELDEPELRAAEPALGPDYRLGVLIPDAGHCTNPRRHAQAIADALAKAGVTFERARALALVDAGGRVTGVATEAGRRVADHVVLAAGAWSAALLRPLGYRVPLESQRGYHVEFAASGLALARPVVPADRKVFVTPMERGVRVAGSVEFAGLSETPTRRRGDLLLADIRAVFPSADLSAPSPYWMGHRPCLPDSLPVIGRAPRHEGLWFAFGHGHLGLTGSAPTGRIVGALISGERPNIDVRPYGVDRF